MITSKNAVKPNSGIGYFRYDANAEYNERMATAIESFDNKFNLNYLNDFYKILQVDEYFDNYKEYVFGEEVTGASMESTGSNFGDYTEKYWDEHYSKINQLANNTRQELLQEASSVGNLQPIVALTMPILQKVYLECQFKDMLQTIVSDGPIINIAYERKFLKDAKGDKYWIPDIFYNDDYQAIMNSSIGKEVVQTWQPLTESTPITHFDVLQASGGSLSRRDALSYDFCVKKIKVNVPTDDDPIETEFEVNVRPNMHTQTFNYVLTVPSQSKTTPGNIEVQLFGNFDPYAGIVNLACIGDITSIQFGGHLSNSNNTEMVELDRQRFDEEITIPEQERLNTGITIDRIKDEKALANIDTTLEMVSDMTEVLGQTKDSNIKKFFEESFIRAKTASNLHPMGYNVKFAWEQLFPLGKAQDFMNPESMWRSQQLRYYFERLLSLMKQQLKTSAIMFCISANPYLIDLLTATDNEVRWIVDNDTKVGGVKLDYKFGVMTVAGTRCHILSSMKETIEKGFRIVAYMLTDTLITYRQYDYTFNIENNYRNNLTPNIPNIMACQRYYNYELLPLQGEFAIEEYKTGNFGLAPDFTPRP